MTSEDAVVAAFCEDRDERYVVLFTPACSTTAEERRDPVGDKRGVALEDYEDPDGLMYIACHSANVDEIRIDAAYEEAETSLEWLRR